MVSLTHLAAVLALVGAGPAVSLQGVTEELLTTQQALPAHLRKTDRSWLVGSSGRTLTTGRCDRENYGIETTVFILFALESGSHSVHD